MNEMSDSLPVRSQVRVSLISFIKIKTRIAIVMIVVKRKSQKRRKRRRRKVVDLGRIRHRHHLRRIRIINKTNKYDHHFLADYWGGMGRLLHVAESIKIGSPTHLTYRYS